jgi:hypothetical protein
MQRTLRGRISGNRIDLTESPELADGQEVEVSLRVLPPTEPRQPGEGFLRTEGALANDPFWDTIMDEV